MNPGYCYIAERNVGQWVLEELIGSLERHGARLRHPVTGAATQIVADGESVAIEPQQVFRQRRPEVVIQLWLDADTYVGCQFLWLTQDKCRHLYSLDGLDQRQGEDLMAWAMKYFKSRAMAGHGLLFVADPEGISDVPWDDVARGNQDLSPLPAGLPYALGLPRSCVTPADVAGVAGVLTVNDCVILVRGRDDDLALVDE